MGREFGEGRVCFGERVLSRSPCKRICLRVLLMPCILSLSPLTMCRSLSRSHFPDLHIEGWVIHVLRKVHFGTLEKMAVHAATRLELICVASRSDSTASTLNVLLMQFTLKFIGRTFLHRNFFFYSLFSHMNITFFRRTFCQQSPHSACHMSVLLA